MNTTALGKLTEAHKFARGLEEDAPEPYTPPPREGWARAIARIIIARRGASAHQIVADLGKRDFYPTENHVRVQLCSLARRGYVQAETIKQACTECGHPRTVYQITEDGRIYAQ